MNSIEGMLDDIETITGIRIKPSFNRKGAEILFVTPSGDLFADPGTFTQEYVKPALSSFFSTILVIIKSFIRLIIIVNYYLFSIIISDPQRNM